MRKRVLATAAAIFAAAATTLMPTTPASAAPLTKVLVFSKTAGFRHSSIPNGIAAIQQLGATNGFTVTATEDAAQFTTANLAQYQVVIWLIDHRRRPQRHPADRLPVLHRRRWRVRRGARRRRHRVRLAVLRRAGRRLLPLATRPSSKRTVRVEAPTNVVHGPPSGHLGAHRRVVQLPHQPAGQRTRAAEPQRVARYSGGTMGDHPITWCQNYGGGRSWYTGLGHTEASYTEANFTRMLLGGIQIAAGAVAADCAAVSNPNPATSFRSRANSRYVTAGTLPLIADATTIGTAQRFDVIDRGGGNIALRARVNNMYVCAENAGAASLIANRGCDWWMGNLRPDPQRQRHGQFPGSSQREVCGRRERGHGAADRQPHGDRPLGTVRHDPKLAVVCRLRSVAVASAGRFGWSPSLGQCAALPGFGVGVCE